MPGYEEIAAAEMQARKTRRSLGNGQWSEWEPHTDLRGTPVGATARRWEWERMIMPPHRRRRARQRVRVYHCPEGWHSTSGSASNPMGPELCHTLLDPQWQTGGGLDRDRFRAFHGEHPVVWIVETYTKRPYGVGRLPYCDPELPDEYRPFAGGQS